MPRMLINRMTPRERRQIEREAREIADIVEREIAQRHGGNGKALGFGLFLLFEFERGGSITWISNAEREDMIPVLEGFVERWKTGTDTSAGDA